MRKLLCLTVLLFVSGCASLNQALTPDPIVKKDDFDGHVEVLQEPVSAASSISEGWNTLGFRWRDDDPDTVYLIAGAEGITNISGLHFNVDGQFIEASKASYLTDYDQWSTRQFKVSFDDFKRISRGKVVKMKVEMIDEYQVSSFGTEVSGAVVNTKFPLFLQSVKGAL